MKTVTITRLDGTHDTAESVIADHHDLNDPAILIQILEDLCFLGADPRIELPTVIRLTDHIQVFSFRLGEVEQRYKVTALDGRRMTRSLIKSLVAAHAEFRVYEGAYFIKYHTGSKETPNAPGRTVDLLASTTEVLVELIQELQP